MLLITISGIDKRMLRKNYYFRIQKQTNCYFHRKMHIYVSGDILGDEIIAVTTTIGMRVRDVKHEIGQLIGIASCDLLLLLDSYDEVADDEEICEIGIVSESRMHVRLTKKASAELFLSKRNIPNNFYKLIESIRTSDADLLAVLLEAECPRKCTKEQTIKSLITRGRRRTDVTPNIPLIHMATHDLRNFKLLVQFGEDPLSVDSRNTSPLMICMKNGHLEVASYLVNNFSNEININHQDDSGNSAMSYAVLAGRSDCVRWVLNITSLDVTHSFTTINNNRLTPLMIASQSGNNHIVQLLLSKTTSTHCLNFEYNGCNATLLAASRGNRRIVEMLFHAGGRIPKPCPENEMLIKTILKNSDIVSTLNIWMRGRSTSRELTTRHNEPIMVR